MADDTLDVHAGAASDGHPVGWLEVLDRTGKVASRYPVTGRSVSVGRAYDNDIVLDDPYACPHHVRISWHEGMLEVVDLGSVNGVVFGPREERLTRELVGNDGRFRLGRTLFRFRRHDCPLPATWVDRPLPFPLHYLERPWVLVLIYLSLLLYKSSAFYLTTTSGLDQVRLVTELVAMVAIVVAWSALWAFPSRLLVGRWNFLVHCGIASVGIVAQGLCETLISFASYMFDGDAAMTFFSQGCSWLILLLVLYAHLSYLVAAPARLLVRWAGGITLVLASLFSLVQYLESERYSASPDYVMSLKPPPLRLTDGEPLQRVAQECATLRDEVDAQLEEAEKKAHNP